MSSHLQRAPGMGGVQTQIRTTYAILYCVVIKDRVNGCVTSDFKAGSVSVARTPIYSPYHSL